MRTVNPGRVAKQRQGIVFAAIRAFSRVGLAESSTNDICREAGISPGRLYYYFKSKDVLIDEVIHYVFNFSHLSSEHLLLQSDQTEDVVDGLVRVYEAIDRYLADAGLSNRLLFEIISSSERRPKLSRLFRTEYEATVKILQESLRRRQQAGTLRPNVDTGSLAERLLLVSTGTRASTLLADKFNSLSQLRRALEAIILPYRALPSTRTAGVERKRRRTV